MNRQAQKAAMFGLTYGKSFFLQNYVEEAIRMISAMAVSRNSGIGYICLEHNDFSSLELRLHSFHDEDQYTVTPWDETTHNRQFTKNQRGRHWDKQRKQEVKIKPKTAQQMLEEDFAKSPPEVAFMHRIGQVQAPRYTKTIACQVVEKGGKLQPMSYRWWIDNCLGIDGIH